MSWRAKLQFVPCVAGQSERDSEGSQALYVVTGQGISDVGVGTTRELFCNSLNE